MRELLDEVKPKGLRERLLKQGVGEVVRRRLSVEG